MRADFKPMLSGKAPDDWSTLKFPLMVSPKLDGVRCIMWGGVAYSRNLKPIPNRHVQKVLAGLPDGFDGELIVGEPTGTDVINRTTSGVMRADGTPKFTYHVFDWYSEGIPFDERVQHVSLWLDTTDPDGDLPVDAVVHRVAESPGVLYRIEDYYVSAGFEGVMVRDPAGAYKFGRSTVKEGGLLKIKRWNDAEAVVVGVVERMHNGNEATKDELGRTKRSSHKANKTGRGDLGAFVCETGDGVRFEIGTGFSDAQRADFWEVRGKLAGAYAKYKFQDLTPDGVPRFPVFIAMRHPNDL